MAFCIFGCGHSPNPRNLDLVIIGIYFAACLWHWVIIFSRKERHLREYSLPAATSAGSPSAHQLFVSTFPRKHFIGLAGSGATSGLAVGHFGMAGLPDAALARLGFRAVLPSF